MQCENLSEGNAEPEMYLNKKAESVAPPQCLPVAQFAEQCSSFAFDFHKHSCMILQDLRYDASLTCSQAFSKPSSHLAASRNLLKNYEMCMEGVPSPEALCTVQGGWGDVGLSLPHYSHISPDKISS